MESPTASTTTTTGELREPIRGCSLSSVRINREDLKRKLMMPKYLRIAVLDSILSKDAAALANWYLNGAEVNGALEQRPEGPVVVFVNSKSGGRHGPELEERLQQLMGEEQGLEVKRQLLEKVHCYEGMDAQIAYGFHHLLNEKPYIAQGPIANKDFDEYMNLVLDDAKEVSIKKKSRKSLGGSDALVS